MKFGNVYVSACYDEGIERVDANGKPEICKGYYCQVYKDAELQDQIDDFCLAVGHEIPDDRFESIAKGIRTYLGLDDQDEHRERVRQTTDGITAEDLLEQAVYVVNAPNCCSESDRAEAMLGMLGANVFDDGVYHAEADHPTIETGGNAPCQTM